MPTTNDPKKDLATAPEPAFAEDLKLLDGHVQVFEIRVESDRLTLNDDGGLVEDPPTLECTEELSTRLIAAHKNRIRDATIVGIEGAYVITLHPLDQTDAFAGPDLSTELIRRLEDHKTVIDLNGLKALPESAAKLGISKPMLRVVEALAEVASHSPSVTIASASVERAELPAPSMDAIRAMPKPPPPPRRVDGKVTAVGLSDDDGVRIEVNRATMLFVEKVSLEEAFNHLTRGAHVTGVNVTTDGKSCLQHARFFGPEEREQASF